MRKNSIIIPLVFLLIGFIAAYVIFGKTNNNHDPSLTINSEKQVTGMFSSVNPFASKKQSPEYSSNLELVRLDSIEDEISQIKHQLKEIEQTLQALATLSDSAPSLANPVNTIRKRFPSILPQRLYNLENLIRGGIAPSLAEDIVRRKNSIELKRLALQDLATRENYLNTQRYYDELNEINKQDVTLREELGDQRYDEYLFSSKQNNRIRISSVMLGSAAEEAGIQKGDVVLSYDDNRMFTWQELKDATSEGQLGEYVSINIYRDGEIYSFSVPRGPLGTQLGSTRLEP